MKQNYGKILVLMGGWSNERNISLISGKYVFESLSSQGFDAVKLDLNRNNLYKIKDINPDRVFIILHGKGGEDGEIQSYLDSLAIPYTGSNAESSKICINKRLTKDILLENDILTPRFKKIHKSLSIKDIECSFNYPFVIKPSSEGSSIGVYIVENSKELKNAINHNEKISDDIFVEDYIKGKEYTVGIINNTALPSIKLIPPGKFYDYNAKYNSTEMQYICPSNLENIIEDKIKEISLKSFNLLGCSGWGRVDIIIDENNQPYVIELNTVPGMTDHSLVPLAAKNFNISFDDLVIKILDTSFK